MEETEFNSVFRTLCDEHLGQGGILGLFPDGKGGLLIFHTKDTTTEVKKVVEIVAGKISVTWLPQVNEVLHLQTLVVRHKTVH